MPNLTQFLPDFLKSDLGIGMSVAEPWTLAIDEMSNSYNHHALQQGLSLQVDWQPIYRMRRELEILGLDLSPCDETEIAALFRRRNEFIHSMGFLSAVETLAHFFLGPHTISKGRGEAPSPLPKAGATQFRLWDTRAGEQTIFVRCEYTPEIDRSTAFLNSCRHFIPDDMKILIAPPLHTKNSFSKNYRLENPIPLAERRL